MAVPHILIVDNDPAAALVTQRGLQMLIGSEATIDLAHSAGAAWLSCVRGEVSLLIVDPGGTDRSTAALVKALHNERPNLPVLVLTAYDTPRLRNQMRNLGVKFYLAKPIDLPELHKIVTVAVG
ncbi:MAG TPA: response regulator [Roseiflexaceae bacterium]|nr:response regulator [Roseiflexaceae bacterium]HMP39259.1 response regulator [Roseiflexaceae bacterium]